ncbi:MarR family winged helix-turn-helix transcriptional regulator [Kitasatospora kifunensis]|uniref:DNA-binding MarR family transcriptional regulator n=1 Tax=Kitasatospora kifunensis TaxID=58351 RepID=A0A7W7VWP1_KITKI|nr:MarR family transcriptional regulator [Kitasatospora kifunensis]MBB4924735.1 DNA-binding MarR family transcriptional regulator [Kitasatospora kifunensis]
MDQSEQQPAAAGVDAVDAIIEQWRVARPDLQTDAMAVFGRIYRLARIMGDRIEKIYQEYGISRGEFDVLATLRRAPAPHTLSPRQLTATLMLTTGGMTGRLDKLERGGLVVRSPDPADRRGLRITLTNAGRAVVDQAATAGLTEQQRALTPLNGEQTQQLNELLRLLLIDI